MIRAALCTLAGAIAALVIFPLSTSDSHAPRVMFNGMCGTVITVDDSYPYMATVKMDNRPVADHMYTEDLSASPSCN